ncbi:MAG TPA: hypothetical protein DCP11_04375 [Microbacteriaceae bacterium]|jgi:hypothetical protein|nr:hypothetical protein [Microbacteriaceae bacterium]
MSQTPSDGPGFDPRFDPAFQPGYDPSVHGHAAPKPEATGAPTDRVERAQPRVVPENRPARAESDPSTGSDADAFEPPPRRLNPFLLALWALSAAFIGLGLYLLRFIGDRLDSLNTVGGGNSSDYYLLQAYTVGAPLLIVLGLATATGTLFLYAARGFHRAR